MPGLMATDTAVFCTELMARPDLVNSPVVQDQCLNVLDAFLRTGGNFGAGAAAHWPEGAQRRPARVAVLRQSAWTRRRRDGQPAHSGGAGAGADAPLLECHAVAGLDVDEDVGFDKFSIRHRSTTSRPFVAPSDWRAASVDS